MSVTHGQCIARPTVTFPASERHCPSTGTKLYCLVTEAHRCEKLAQSFYAVVLGRDSNPRPLDRESDALPQHHDATMHMINMVACDWLTARWDSVTAGAPRHVSCDVGPHDQPQYLSLLTSCALVTDTGCSGTVSVKWAEPGDDVGGTCRLYGWSLEVKLLYFAAWRLCDTMFNFIPQFVSLFQWFCSVCIVLAATFFILYHCQSLWC